MRTPRAPCSQPTSRSATIRASTIREDGCCSGELASPSECFPAEGPNVRPLFAEFKKDRVLTPSPRDADDHGFFHFQLLPHHLVECARRHWSAAVIALVLIAAQ